MSPHPSPEPQKHRPPVDAAFRLPRMTLVAIGVGLSAAAASSALRALIALFTNALWFGRATSAPVEAFDHHLPLVLAVVLPALGGIVVGLMARYGSPKIRGHGIPEVMESVLLGESKIAPRVAVLKPLSAAIAIGSGGPFGAEGPIIATGGALGSIIGQVLPVSPVERKALLAAGAAAGMSAMFGSPVAAVILAVELLLFEMRPRTLIPVAIASVIAFAASRLDVGPGPLFPMPEAKHACDPIPLVTCCVLGIAAGLAGALITKVVYWVEDAFEKLPIHWMWWPAIGGVVVGLTGLVEPRVLGVGYRNIGDALSGDAGRLGLAACASIALWKLVAWSISLGTGTSGGVLAPVLTVGATLGAALGMAIDRIDPRLSPGVGVCALAVMSGVFAGTARAPMATVVFAVELTHRIECMPAVLATTATAQLITVALLTHSIMTEKIARRGIPIGHEYSNDPLALIRVGDVMTREVLTVPAQLSAAELLRWFGPDGLRTRHQGYPVVDPRGRLVGVISRKDLRELDSVPTLIALDVCSVPAIVTYADEPLAAAKERFASLAIGRLVVVERDDPAKIVGILSRSDLIEALPRLRTRAAVGGAVVTATPVVRDATAPEAEATTTR